MSAALPMNEPDAAVKEAERILINGNANGLQIHTNVNGHCLDEPQFLPIFEVAAKSGKPVLLHPARSRELFRTSRPKPNRNTRSGRCSAGRMRPAPPWRAWSSRA